MPWTFEWAAHMHGLYSREAFLELAALTGLVREKPLEDPRRHIRPATNCIGSAADQRARLSDVVTRLWRRQRL